MRTLVTVAIGLVLGCGSSGPITSPEPVAPAEAPVIKVYVAWVLTAAPTELDVIECMLTLLVIDEHGKETLHQVGRWWRLQTTLYEPVEPTPPGEPALFRTAAVMGSGGQLTDEPQFEVLREPAGALVVRGRDKDTPWQELAHVSLPASTRVRPQMPH
ncbi:hypothetical protein [Nannocystis pusilla]|uniref:Lipoprotein n=1 Tax=Nannocystis pusilla TaxID=889268 RepID=A0ABS7TPP0_9BACT|nr:hypothetical protein [Nannocystis pusilla]MBZ5710026.1 hypothetical protein [Nannocystis pusilla]